jgi:very-short-patch-repair endonuclease
MQRRRIPYNPRLKQRTRELRRNATLVEVLLWEQIGKGKLGGYDFHRQKPIGEYIVDFFCYKLGLKVEIDGSSHNSRLEADSHRQRELEEMGLSVLRFQDAEVKRNLQGVVLAIREWIDRKERGLV